MARFMFWCTSKQSFILRARILITIDVLVTTYLSYLFLAVFRKYEIYQIYRVVLANLFLFESKSNIENRALLMLFLLFFADCRRMHQNSLYEMIFRYDEYSKHLFIWFHFKNWWILSQISNHFFFEIFNVFHLFSNIGKLISRAGKWANSTLI